MGRASPAISSFAGGEFAPQMEGRTDVEKYAVASHVQQNFIALKQGPSTFRQGFAYVQPVKTSTDRTWLQRFEFSQTQAFVVEFGNFYVRFYTNHGPLLSTGAAAYDSSVTYQPGATVSNLGFQYYCIQTATGIFPNDVNYWYQMPQYNGSFTTAIYEIPSPYAAVDLTDSLGEFTLQIVQSGDVLYIAGGFAGTGPSGVGYPPYTLTRFANAPPQWIFAQYQPTNGPFAQQPPLVPGTEVALSATGTQGSITINSWGGNAFAATDVGRLVRMQSQVFNLMPWATATGWTAGQTCVNNGNDYIALNTATSGGSPPLHTAGSVLDGPTGVRWLYTDSGYGVARITAYVSGSQVSAQVLSNLPASVVQSVATITGISNSNPGVIAATNSFVLGAPIFIIGVTGMPEINQQPYTSGGVNGSQITLAGIDTSSYGTYSSGGTVIQNATVEWALGAWSNTTEWPRANGFFKDRLFWAGKLNVWGSVPGQYLSQAPDEFGIQTTASAINVIVAGSDASNICWLSGANVLLIGTEGGEYGLDAANYSTSPLGPSNVEILRQSNWRCRHVAAQLVGISVLYVQRAGRKVFAMDYNFYLNRYDSADQSKFAYHISIGGITSMAYQQEPWSIVWATRTDGTLLSYTFNREDNVTAWCRHNVGGGGLVESLAVIPSPDGSRDELWMIVNRTVNGQTIRTVEYMVKHYEGPQAGYAGDAQSSCWYVDCGVQSVVAPPAGASTTTITGLPPVLIGQTVAILADGGVQPQQLVPSSGSITLEGAFTTVTIGLPYQGNLVPMRPEGGADVGTSQGKKKQGTNLVIRLVDSAGGQIGQLSNQNALGIYQDPLGQTALTATNFEPISTNYTTTGLDQPPPLQSGDFPVSFPMDALSDQDASDFYILVQQNQPLPMTVAGLFPSYNVQEP